MPFEIQEKVIFYNRSQLLAWRKGDKSLILDFLERHAVLQNQQAYHFGEYFALRYYHELDGWLGFNFYALGSQYPNSKKCEAGRRKVEEIIPAKKLSRFRSLRTEDVLKAGAGEPDLFLYKNSGEYMFVEVKKQTDRIRPEQLKCMAQLRVVLECPVEIVYLCADGRFHKPKTYILDLESFTGQRRN